MVVKYPPTLELLKKSRVNIPESEQIFFDIVDCLDDNWHVWHSVNWDNDAKMESGEADFLIFHEEYGFLVIEAKGCLISVESNEFYTTPRNSTRKEKIKNPYEQARNTMFKIKDFYIKRAKNEQNPNKLLKVPNQFPLSFNYGVFLPDTEFKSNPESFQYSHNKVFAKHRGISCSKGERY